MNTIPHPSEVAVVKTPVKPASRDPLIKAARKAYRDSATGRLEALLKERSRWQRKVTIAQNKLDSANRSIADFATMLANEKDGVKE